MSELPRAWPRQPLLNVWADDMSMADLLQRLATTGGVVFTVNPDHLYHLQYNPAFLAAYRSADIITVDSHYVRLALRAQGRTVVNRLPGSDIVPAFCARQAGDARTRIFLLGARPGVAQRARESMNRKAGRELVVGAHGPSMNFVNDPLEIEAVLKLIQDSGATVLLVGLGAPKQEIWIASVRHRLPQVRVMMGIGATIDYEAGEVKRAPEFLRRLGLEWTYRVSTEPRRYLMRYVRSSKFLWWMLMDRLGRYTTRSPTPPRLPLAEHTPSRDGLEKKMKMKTLATCSPMLLCLVAGAARADLQPFSFDASETIQHESNIVHAEDVGRKSDWLSTTELKAALDQAIGRERLLGAASVNADRYGSLRGRDSIGYSGSAELDWSTVGDLSGAIGADSRRRQYIYGQDGGQSSTSRNLQTDNHAFARVQLGGLARWSIFSGFDASQRKYSDPSFDANELQQWAVSGGSSYETSPDLSFGVHGRYVRGKYPNVVLPTGEEGFSVKTVGVNTKWVASGNSSFDANMGYTQQRTDGQPEQHYINGGVNWRWVPPSRFTVTLGVQRDSSTNSGTGATVVNANNSVNSRSLNTIAHLDVTYALTAKISLDALVQYIHRKYSDALVPDGTLDANLKPRLVSVTGASNTSRFSLSAHYMPTRTTNLSCGYAREVHSADQSINLVSKSYSDNTVMCAAAIHFD